MEEWKPCPRFEDIYHVSNLGRVKRIVPGAGRAKVGGILQPGKNPKGYRAVNLCRNGVKHTRYIHRLVCEAFHGPVPTEMHQAAHKDDSKENNVPDNLYWATSMQNGSEDRRRNGRIVRGSRVGRAKLKEADIPAIRAMRERGAVHREIAEAFGVRQNTISRVLAGKRWGHLSP